MDQEEKSKIKSKLSKLSSEEKKTYIAYAVIGLFVLCLVFYAVTNFDSAEDKKVEEFTTPETEANKYNSKTDALNGGKEQDTTVTGGFDNITMVTQEKPAVEKEDLIEQNVPIKATSKKTTSREISPKKLRTEVKQKKEIPVHTEIPEEPKPSYQGVNSSSINDFFSTNRKSNPVEKKSVIYAVIKGDQIGVKNNQRVTLLLSNDIKIDDKVFKKNTLIYAQASFSNSRVNFTVTNINQYPIALLGYDAQDGNLGLQVSESFFNDATGEVVDDQANDLGVNDIPIVGRTIGKLLKKGKREVKIDLLNNQKMILKPVIR